MSKSTRRSSVNLCCPCPTWVCSSLLCDGEREMQELLPSLTQKFTHPAVLWSTESHHSIPTPSLLPKMIHLPSAPGRQVLVSAVTFSTTGHLQHEPGREQGKKTISKAWAETVSLPLPLLRSNGACGTANRLPAAELGWICQCYSAAKTLFWGKTTCYFFTALIHPLFIYLLNNGLSCWKEFGKKNQICIPHANAFNTLWYY